MTKRRMLRAALGELRVRGSQRAQLEADLLAQLVVMLGRQLSAESRDANRLSNDAAANDADEGAEL